MDDDWGSKPPPFWGCAARHAKRYMSSCSASRIPLMLPCWQHGFVPILWGITQPADTFVHPLRSICLLRKSENIWEHEDEWSSSSLPFLLLKLCATVLNHAKKKDRLSHRLSIQLSRSPRPTKSSCWVYEKAFLTTNVITHHGLLRIDLGVIEFPPKSGHTNNLMPIPNSYSPIEASSGFVWNSTST